MPDFTKRPHWAEALQAVALAAAALLATPVLALAQADVPGLTPASAEPASQSLNYSLIDLIQFGGWVGYVIMALSVVAVSLVIQYALTIRAANLMPTDQQSKLRTLADEGRWDDITGWLERPDASYLATIVASGVKERDRGWDAVVKAMEDSSDALTGQLLRRIEHLNIIANISPMLGLLGTVMGMVNSFNQISIAVGGVDPRRLAGGIFEALMTTVMGLVVAIPALYMFGIFRNRVDALGYEIAQIAEDLVEPLKRS
jgi:biopolymer transport protein ExbB